MTEFVFVKPAEGGRVRMPERNSNVMPAEGALVPRIDYYERLILAGDVVVTDAPKEEKPQREPAAPTPASRETTAHGVRHEKPAR